MSSPIRSRFLRSLEYEAGREEIIALFGEPEDRGKGVVGSQILAFHRYSIQMALLKGRLVAISFSYWRPETPISSWPPEVLFPATLSGEMTLDKVTQRLDAEDLPWKLLRIANAADGDPFLMVGEEIQISFTEEGRLYSVHVSCYLPTSDPES